MKYVTASMRKAASVGMELAGKLRCGEDEVMLNESGVMNCPGLEGSLEERAAELGGRVMTEEEALAYKRELGLGVEDFI